MSLYLQHGWVLSLINFSQEGQASWLVLGEMGSLCKMNF